MVIDYINQQHDTGRVREDAAFFPLEKKLEIIIIISEFIHEQIKEEL